MNPRVAAVGLTACVIGYLAVFTLGMRYTSYNIWGALWVAPVLVIISLPALLRFARRQGEPDLARLLVIAVILKLMASLPRYYMAFGVYGTGDSMRYDITARALRQEFLAGDFGLGALGVDDRTGTQFLEIVAGIVYTAIGPSIIGAFVVFSWMGFWGIYYFYRAFRVAIPDGDAKRYGLLVFFLPSMLFWPSSIGKEAFMLLALGLTTYGCVLLLSRRRGATIHLVLGLAGVVMLRPHVALPVIAGLGLAYLLRGQGVQRIVAMGKMRTFIGLAAIGGITLLVSQQVARFFGVDEFNVDTATETLNYTEGQTAQGGSEFEGGGPSLINMPLNLVTVLFRPFPFEVHNVQSLLTALEGTFLLVLFIMSIPRLRAIPRRARQQPYVIFAITYVLLFCFMFSTFQNFGILARERVMVYPIVLVLIALPAVQRAVRHRSGRRPTRRDRVPETQH